MPFAIDRIGFALDTTSQSANVGCESDSRYGFDSQCPLCLCGEKGRCQPRSEPREIGSEQTNVIAVLGQYFGRLIVDHQQDQETKARYESPDAVKDPSRLP